MRPFLTELSIHKGSQVDHINVDTLDVAPQLTILGTMQLGAPISCGLVSPGMRRVYSKNTTKAHVWYSE